MKSVQWAAQERISSKILSAASPPGGGGQVRRHRGRDHPSSSSPPPRTPLARSGPAIITGPTGPSVWRDEPTPRRSDGGAVRVAIIKDWMQKSVAYSYAAIGRGYSLKSYIFSWPSFRERSTTLTNPNPLEKLICLSQGCNDFPFVLGYPLVNYPVPHSKQFSHAVFVIILQEPIVNQRSHKYRK